MLRARPASLSPLPKAPGFDFLVSATLALAFCVVVLGAYVRLSDAGLGCPDWPGCYGRLTVPATSHEHAAAAAFPDRPLEAAKAWKEMIHRYAAGSLGLLILALTVRTWRPRHRQRHSPLVPSLLLALVVFQALLGMWTVTLLLKPAVVTAHLLGGMTTFALLCWLFCRDAVAPVPDARPGLRLATRLVLGLVFCQIALGGWVSSNYAALMCPELPSCRNGEWLPAADYAAAFQLHRELGRTADGALLGSDALTAIHLAHRFGALAATLAVGALAIVLRRRRDLRRNGDLLLLALAFQLCLGMANVLAGLPLALAVAHNAGAALLLAALVAVLARLGTRRRG